MNLHDAADPDAPTFAPAQDDGKECPFCGRMVEDGSPSCPVCGTSLTAPTPARITPSSPIPTSNQPSLRTWGDTGEQPAPLKSWPARDEAPTAKASNRTRAIPRLVAIAALLAIVGFLALIGYRSLTDDSASPSPATTPASTGAVGVAEREMFRGEGLPLGVTSLNSEWIKVVNDTRTRFPFPERTLVPFAAAAEASVAHHGTTVLLRSDYRCRAA